MFLLLPWSIQMSSEQRFGIEMAHRLRPLLGLPPFPYSVFHVYASVLIPTFSALLLRCADIAWAESNRTDWQNSNIFVLQIPGPDPQIENCIYARIVQRDHHLRLPGWVPHMSVCLNVNFSLSVSSMFSTFRLPPDLHHHSRIFYSEGNLEGIFHPRPKCRLSTIASSIFSETIKKLKY